MIAKPQPRSLCQGCCKNFSNFKKVLAKFAEALYNGEQLVLECRIAYISGKKAAVYIEGLPPQWVNILFEERPL